MKATRNMMAMLGGALLTTGLLAAPSVEITAVQQQYPWTNTVDITYEVRGVTNMEYFVRFTPTTSDDDPILNTEGEASIQVALESNGVFTAQWYPQTNLQYTACKMTPAIFRGGSGGGNDYMIVDLETWQVTYEPMATQEASNERYNTDEYKTKKLVLRKISPGRYTIGHADQSNNKPHVVEVPEGTCYYFGVFHVTESQYERIMGTSTTGTSKIPFHDSSWSMLRGGALANARLQANANNTSSVLIRLSGLTGVDFDLPTEEMWEIAARAGATTRYWFGDDISSSSPLWYGGNNSSGMMHNVGEKAPNNWGIFDAQGNCWQWCRDVYQSDGFATKTTDIYTPVAGAGNNRVLRGCHFDDNDPYKHLSYRFNYSATSKYTRRGLRLAVVVK